MNDSSTSTIASKSNLERQTIRRERIKLVLKDKTFIVGALILSFWIILAIFGTVISPRGAGDTISYLQGRCKHLSNQGVILIHLCLVRRQLD